MFTHLDALPYATKASMESPCRSKRGVVIFDPLHPGFMERRFAIKGTGWNHQPAPFICDGSEACKATCGKTAVHAEQMAIARAEGFRLEGMSLLHIKTHFGYPLTSGGPSCLECSKLILEVGIATVWLLHEDGWREYSAVEFHELTLLHHQIPVKRAGSSEEKC